MNKLTSTARSWWNSLSIPQRWSLIISIVSLLITLGEKIGLIPIGPIAKDLPDGFLILVLVAAVFYELLYQFVFPGREQWFDLWWVVSVVAVAFVLIIVFKENAAVISDRILGGMACGLLFFSISRVWALVASRPGFDRISETCGIIAGLYVGFGHVCGLIMVSCIVGSVFYGWVYIWVVKQEAATDDLAGVRDKLRRWIKRMTNCDQQVPFNAFLLLACIFVASPHFQRMQIGYGNWLHEQELAAVVEYIQQRPRTIQDSNDQFVRLKIGYDTTAEPIRQLKQTCDAKTAKLAHIVSAPLSEKHFFRDQTTGARFAVAPIYYVTRHLPAETTTDIVLRKATAIGWLVAVVWCFCGLVFFVLRLATQIERKHLLFILGFSAWVAVAGCFYVMREAIEWEPALVEETFLLHKAKIEAVQRFITAGGALVEILPKSGVTVHIEYSDRMPGYDDVKNLYANQSPRLIAINLPGSTTIRLKDANSRAVFELKRVFCVQEFALK